MNLKKLGAKLAVNYAISRLSGSSKKDSALNATMGATVAQAKEDIDDFDSKVIDTAHAVLDVVDASHSTVEFNSVVNCDEVELVHSELTNSKVGITQQELESEVRDLQEGITDGYLAMLRLERLKAGVIKRVTE